ncbi:MAG: ABC transporter substrate-binding protein [Oscillospiraceae bacterium]|jgi:branched-chain amino acid transport system substrate-binding protein
MKKILSLILTLSLVFVSFACAAPQEAAPASSAPSSAPAEQSTSAQPSDSAGEAETSSGDTYRVGVLLPLTGRMASGGQEAMRGLEMALDMVNENGGIQGKPLELIFCDANDADSGIAEATRLIEVEKVKVITGTYMTEVSFSASTIAEQNKTVFFEMACPSDGLCSRGYKYYFRMNPTASDEGRFAAQFAVENAEKMGTTKDAVRVAIVGEDSTYGSTIAAGAVAQLEEYGITPVLREEYSTDVTDLSSLIMKLIDAKPDVVISCSLLADASLFYRQAYELGLEVKAFVGNGAGFGSATFLEQFGEVANYLFATNYTIETSPAETAPGLADFYKEYRARYNQEPVNSVLVPQVGQGLLILQEILNSAEDVNDATSIADAFRAIDIPSGTMINGWGAKFAGLDSETPGQNLAVGNVIMAQWQDNVLYQVWPYASEGTEIVLPAPMYGAQQ